MVDLFLVREKARARENKQIRVNLALIVMIIMMAFFLLLLFYVEAHSLHRSHHENGRWKQRPFCMQCSESIQWVNGSSSGCLYYDLVRRLSVVSMSSPTQTPVIVIIRMHHHLQLLFAEHAYILYVLPLCAIDPMK